MRREKPPRRWTFASREVVPGCFLRIAAMLAAVAAVTSVGCGGNDRGGMQAGRELERRPRGEALPPARQRRAFEAQQAITAYCARLDRSLKGGVPSPRRAQEQRAHAAAERLAALARERPYDLVQTGVDMRLYLGDLIEDLGNVDCEARLVETLEAGLG